MVRVDLPLIAVASNSDSRDFAVPGSPTSISPRPVASVTSMRSIDAAGATILRSTPSSASPRMNLRAAVRLSTQPGGRGPLSFSRRRCNSCAWRISAGGRCKTGAAPFLFFVILLCP